MPGRSSWPCEDFTRTAISLFRRPKAGCGRGRCRGTGERLPVRAVPVIVRADDSRRALCAPRDAFFGHPSQRLKLIGITGTNGKTTTTYLVKSIIEAAGHGTGLIGTIDYRVGDKVYPAPNTTPESLDLQRLLAEMVGLGAELLRHGGLIARACARQDRRMRVRGCRVHEPDAGPPGFS